MEQQTVVERMYSFELYSFAKDKPPTQHQSGDMQEGSLVQNSDLNKPTSWQSIVSFQLCSWIFLTFISQIKHKVALKMSRHLITAIILTTMTHVRLSAVMPHTLLTSRV